MADEEEEVMDHAPFGDTFGTRSNYATGLMYSGRRRFMHELADSDNALRPPQLFMTRQQSLRNAMLSKSDKLQSLSNMAYFRDEAAANNQAQSNKRKILIKRKIVPTEITFTTFSSTDPADWEEEFIAGCHMWTNHGTGEVSEVCPWGEDGKESARKLAEEEDDEGTGAPVYDGTELGELFDMLDTYKSPSPSTATSPAKK